MGQKRDLTLDLAKAICIILMVIGHSGCPDYLHRFIYMFHMPCFFFISGYLLNDKYLTNLKTGLWRIWSVMRSPLNQRTDFSYCESSVKSVVFPI